MEENVNGGGMELQEPESSSLERVDEIAALLDGDDAEEQQEEGEGTRSEEEQPSEEDGTRSEEEPEEPEEQPEPEAEDVPEGWDEGVF